MSRATLAILLVAGALRADDATDTLARELRDYATAELAKVPGKDGKYSTILANYLRKGIEDANKRDREAWAKIKTKAQWEEFRDERIKSLRSSLGHWPEVPKTVPTHVTRTIEASDYCIDNLLYESRPGVWVTGNLYRPAARRELKTMPVFLIAHSHHAPKHEGELQDMGVTWAKLGCLVLVIDQLGHGERRQHPFVDAKSYPKEFRVGRQDYFFRYNLGLQLSLVGDSLMGWMVWDMMRGLDVALGRPGADKDRVILLGSVAGGGDPAAVTAALDPRITCVVPFNFGGPQPETRYPLPDNAEETFNYAGGGSWESTRNLRDSAARGFLPWLIVASVAPRKVIHAHEFSWDRERDPVWKRYQKVWGFYDAGEGLSFTHGTGVIRGNDPTASHCNNIGPVHRKGIYATLNKWFDIPVPATESKDRRPASDLKCRTPETERELKPRPLHEVLREIAERQATEIRKADLERPAADRELAFTRRLSNLMSPGGECKKGPKRFSVDLDGTEHCAERLHVFSVQEGDPSLLIWMFSRKKGDKAAKPIGSVLCFAADGKARFLRERAAALAEVLQSGAVVYLVEFERTSEPSVGVGRDRSSADVGYSSTAQMLNESLLSKRWFDVMEWISRMGNQLDGPLLFWGENFARPNLPSTDTAVPHGLAQPRNVEPLGPIIASTWPSMLHVKGTVARGGLVSFRSVLDSPFVHVPHDSIPTDVFRAGDLPDLWAHMAPTPLRLEGLVDGTNRRVTGAKLDAALKPVRDKYAKGGLVVKEEYSPDAELAKWIVEQLKAK